MSDVCEAIEEDSGYKKFALPIDWGNGRKHTVQKLPLQNLDFLQEPLVRVRDEMIDGVYMMSPSPTFWHGKRADAIHSAIKRAMDKSCYVSMKNLDFKYHPNDEDEGKRDDYVCPDIMLMCNMLLVKGNAYYGVPKFIAEVTSPSTEKHDRTVKRAIYEAAGVSEYWIVVPDGMVEIYYLNDGHLDIDRRLILIDDVYDKDYNENDIIALREFPEITMTLAEIFK